MKRIAVDAASTVLSLIDNTKEIEILINNEKTKSLCEEFLTAESTADPNSKFPPVF